MSYDAHERDKAINRATKGALYTGVKAGCDRDNRVNVAVGLPPDDCAALARDLVEDYLRSQP